MEKTVYSLVLTPEVVEAVDRMAYARDTSRSNLVDQLLAEAVGYITPERRMAEIVQSLAEEMAGLYQLQEQATDGVLTIRSPLRYRYKPTIRYRVELCRQPTQAIGILHAAFRTQSRPLLDDANAFFRCWAMHEVAHGECTAGDFALSDGGWDRQFRLRTEGCPAAEDCGRAISGYVKRVDAALKSYFAALPDRAAAAAAVAGFFG